MHIQSKPARAIVRDRCVPGSICHAPKERPEPVPSAFRKVFAFLITAAILEEEVWRLQEIKWDGELQLGWETSTSIGSNIQACFP